jgi:hypothetical protein
MSFVFQIGCQCRRASKSFRSLKRVSPETFADHVWQYCEWAESDTHDLDTVYQLLVELMQAAPGLKTWCGFPPLPTFPGRPREVSWAETKRFADLPFECYPPLYWPHERHPEGPWTDNIHEDFAHIYAELRYGLQATELGGIMQASRYWRDSYFFHWGHHGLAAVWAIEWYREQLKHSAPDASEMAAGPRSLATRESRSGHHP